jgi:hypothetical protein
MLSFVPLIGFTVVEGFVPLSTPGRVTAMIHRSNNVQYFHQAFVRLSASQQDGNSNQGEGDPTEEAIETSTSVSEELLDGWDDDDYDFEAGFQARLKQEGGRKGIQVKAAKRSVDSATKAVTSGLKQSKQNVDLLSLSEWNLTLGFLALVVVLAVGTHFASPAPFETSSTGEQLGFGGR